MVGQNTLLVSRNTSYIFVFLDIFFSGCMDWGGLDLQDRGFWIRDILDIIVSGCMDLGRSGSSGQELLDSWRLSLAWLLHLKVQRVH